MNKEDLKIRTKKFATEVFIFLRTLEKNDEARVLKNQLLRSASSIAANYRSVCRGKSGADFLNKLKVVDEEADESFLWLEMISDLNLSCDRSKLKVLIKEADELTAIFSASIKTFKSNHQIQNQFEFTHTANPKIPNPEIPNSNFPNPKFQMIYEFNSYKPVIHESSFVHPQATVTGNVIIGKNVYIGPGAAIRGDWGEIIIEDGCNVQENCVIHMFPGTTVLLKESAHIGHGAIIHGATIGKNALVGMNAVVMDNVSIGDNCIIGALTFVPEGMIIPERKVVVGNPAKMVKDVTDEMTEWKTKGTQLYQQLPAELYSTLKECEPLREIPKNRPKQQDIYKTWKRTSGK